MRCSGPGTPSNDFALIVSGVQVQVPLLMTVPSLCEMFRSRLGLSGLSQRRDPAAHLTALVHPLFLHDRYAGSRQSGRLNHIYSPRKSV